MAQRASLLLGLCFLVLPLSFVAAIYWLLFVQNHKTSGGGSPRHGIKVEQNTTIEFSIPIKVVGHVIGKKGSNVRRVEESTSTRIRFKECTKRADEKVVVITGRAEAAAQARAAIEETIEAWLKPDEPYTATVNIPSDVVGRIIGRQGSNIRIMQSETGARIKIDSARCGDERLCTIQGNEKQVQRAQQLLVEAIREIDGKSEAVAVPVEAVGRIIGRQGSNIQRMQRDSGATIKYDRNSSGDGVGKFFVQGTEDQIERAKQMLLDFQTMTAVMQEVAPTQSDTIKCLIMTEIPKVCDYFSVFVSAVEADGNVWLQLVGKTCNELDALVDKMTLAYESLTLEQDRLSKVTVGTLCAAPFHSDGSWYRAVVEGLDTIAGTTTVRYVDFGDTNIVEVATLKLLRSEYLILPAQAVRCSLANVKCGKNWSAHSEEDLHILTRCSTWTPLMARTVDSAMVPPRVELIDTTTDKDMSIASEMVAMGHMEWIQDTSGNPPIVTPPVLSYISLPPVGSVFAAFVTSVQDLDVLFIQPQSFQSEAKVFIARINELYINASPQAMQPSALAPGSIVAAYYEELWHRAQMISCDNHGDNCALLRFLDNGHCHRVPVHHVQPILPELMECPLYAVPCCLADIVPAGVMWDMAAIKFVRNHIKAGQDVCVMAVVLNYQETLNGRLAAVTLTLKPEGHTLNRLLIEAGLAVPQGLRNIQSVPALQENNQEEQQYSVG